MPNCAIKWCGKSSKSSNFTKDNVTFHRYPKDPDIKEKWINATRREKWFPSPFSVICSQHFTQDCFINMKNRRRLLNSAVPTLRLPLLSDATLPADETSTLNDEPEVTESDLLLTSVLKLSEFTGSKSTSSEFTSSLDPSQSTSTTTKIIKLSNSDCKTPLKYNIPSSVNEKRLSRRIIELSNKVVQKNKLIKNLKDKNRYMKRKLISLTSNVKDLEKKLVNSNTDILNKIVLTTIQSHAETDD